MLQMRDATERTLQLPIQMRRTKHVQSDELTVSFDDAAIHEWTLGLCLLKEGLVSRLIVTELKPSFRLEIRLDESLPREKRAVAVLEKMRCASSSVARNWITGCTSSCAMSETAEGRGTTSTSRRP